MISTRQHEITILVDFLLLHNTRSSWITNSLYDNLSAGWSAQIAINTDSTIVLYKYCVVYYIVLKLEADICRWGISWGLANVHFLHFLYKQGLDQDVDN